MVPEFQLARAAAQGEAQDLVTQADPENRQVLGQRAHRLVDSGVHPRRVTGTVRKKDRVRLQGERGFRGSTRRNHRDLESLVDQAAQDVALDTEIVGHQPERRRRPLGPRALALDPGPATLVPGIGRFATHLRREVSAVQSRGRLRFTHERLRILALGIGGEYAPLESPVPDATHQRPRIEVGNGRNPVPFQVRTERRLGPPAARNLEVLLHDEAGKERTRGFFVRGVDTHVADLGRSQCHDLAGVGGVGQDFLVARQAGIETHLSDTEPP